MSLCFPEDHAGVRQVPDLIAHWLRIFLMVGNKSEQSELLVIQNRRVGVKISYSQGIKGGV